MEAPRAGADAYLLKDGPSRHLLDAVNFVRDGGVCVSPLLRGFFTKSEKGGGPRPVDPQADEPPVDPLASPPRCGGGPQQPPPPAAAYVPQPPKRKA
jgi:hypothetical protein